MTNTQRRAVGRNQISAFIILPFLCYSQPQRPNILFIMTDDHAVQAVSAYRSRINQTPNLDRIANEGMRFNRSFCTNSMVQTDGLGHTSFPRRAFPTSFENSVVFYFWRSYI